MIYDSNVMRGKPIGDPPTKSPIEQQSHVSYITEMAGTYLMDLGGNQIDVSSIKKYWRPVLLMEICS